MQNKATELNKNLQSKCNHKQFIFFYKSNIGIDDLYEDCSQ